MRYTAFYHRRGAAAVSLVAIKILGIYVMLIALMGL
jgi:hypothetical protein